jgi:hypothetical protein
MAEDLHPFHRRAETLGFDTTAPWSFEAVRMLTSTPRAYRPLVDAWERHHPGTKRALRRLVDGGWVAHQPAVIIDTRTGELAPHPGKPVARYRTTAKGKRLLDAAEDDLRHVEAAFPKANGDNLAGVLTLLEWCDLDGSHARYGLSGSYAAANAGLNPRTGRWWIRHLVAGGYLRELERRWADVREVVPEHWRLTRQLCNQLRQVIDAFDHPASLRTEFRLGRDRFLDDIDPARIGISGATDFDHDVETQRIVAALIDSPAWAREGRFVIEPRYHLPLIHGDVGIYDPEGEGFVYYQPDAEIREQDSDGARRCIVEYERYQSRRDGWDHIERFCGYLHTKALPFETAVLRFVVDSPQRVRSYVELIEAYADHLIDAPERRPRQRTWLAVTSVDKVSAAADPLDWGVWHRLELPAAIDGTPCRPAHHGKTASPYDDYFRG